MKDVCFNIKICAMYKHFFALLLVFLFSLEVCAENLNLTKITDTNNKIDIEFNDTLKLCDFTFSQDNLISPFYENNGNKYYFFYFLDRQFKNDIITKIKDKKSIVNTGKGKIEYKINKCSIVKTPKTILAFMSVIFNDNIEVSCNILNGKYGLWVSWPSIKERDKWKKIFDIKDKNLKEEIDTKLIKYYK